MLSPVSSRRRVMSIVIVFVFTLFAFAFFSQQVFVKSEDPSVGTVNLGGVRQMPVVYRGTADLVDAMSSGQVRARALTAADLNGDAAPDVVAGYEWNGTGIVTVQRGNTDAFAPKDDSVFERMHGGYNPDSLVSVADAYQVPEGVDFLQVGDFNHDNRNDVLVGARRGGLFLLAGDGVGRLGAPDKIDLAGTVTSMTAGEFRAPDGWTDTAVAIEGPSGAELLIFDGIDGVAGTPLELSLPGVTTAMEFGEVDSTPFKGLAVATGSEINVIHGWGRKQSPELETRVERIDTGMNIRGLTLGFFIWTRDGNKQLAALGDDGTIRIFGRGELNTQPLSDRELTARARLRLQPKDTTEIDIETLSGWQAGQGQGWTKARELVTGNLFEYDATTRNLLRSTHISFTGTDDLIVLGGSSKIDIIRQVDTRTSAPTNLIGGDFTVTSLESTDASDTMALPQKLNGWRDLLMMDAGSVSPKVVPLAPTAIISVDRIDDPSGAALTAASACTGAANDCSLRGAVQFANVPANAGSTINLGTATYTLNINGNGGCVRESAATGNTIGDLEVNQTTTFIGTGQASTIINQIGTGTGPTFTGDRVLCMNVPLTAGLTFSFSAMTVAGGRDVASGIGGGGFIGGAKSTTLNLTNVTFANNQTSPGVPQGPVGGGGVSVTGGNMNVTSCTFGAANFPGASRTDLTLGNAATTLSGGGLSYSAGDPLGSAAATGTLAITGTTFTHNTSSSVSGGGGGLDVLEFNTSVGTINVSTSTFTQNQATGTASGGGIINKSVNALNISTTSFTSNSAGNRGGGLYVGGGTTNLNGTTPSITFSGNTATTAGSSISAASFVNLSGTNTTIGGDLEITTNGVWTNQAGSTMSPTNFIMTGTASFTGNNSTTNVGGNFTFGSGTFTAGTSLFNFNGTTAQSLSNSSAITFFNLTDSNITQPLTLNNSFAVNGTLNINGANAILAPVAAAVISGGTGTLTGSGTAQVRRTGADSFFTQYTMPTRTLTNLTVEYIGAAAQTASVTTYNVLKINNGSGVSLGAGTTTVNNSLLLTAGPLNVGTSTLVINNGITVGTGSLTSAATGTVNYNQSSAGQNVIAANYGNLTFSAFTKVFAATGTIGIAGTFNPNGVTTGHTITGSTINFNGTGAQTVPVFNYNNLTISGTRGGATVTLASGIIGVAGTFTPSATGVVYSFTGNTFDFNGTGAQTVPVFNYNNLTISGNRGGAAITFAGGIIGIAGVFNPSVTNNTFVTTGNTVNYSGTVAQTIPAFAFFNGLTLNNATGASLGGNVTVGGALTLTSGALAVGTNTLTLNGAVSATAGSLTSAATGTVIYNQGSNGQAVVLAANYGNLTFSNFSKTLASTGTIGIAGTFTPGTGTGHTITGSTIDFNGAGAQTIPGFTYNNLTSSGGAVGRTLDPVNAIKIAGVFTPGTNAYSITGSTVEYNGGALQTLPATFTTYNNLTINNPVGATGFAGLNVLGLLRIQAGTFTTSSTFNNVQIDVGAVLTANAASTINVTGNWVNNGTFNGNTGTVNLIGSSPQNIGGSFSNLTVNNATGVNLTSATTVNGTLNLTSGVLAVGSNSLTLNSTVTGAGGSISSAANGTVNYNQSSNGQNVLAAAYGNLTFSNFTKILPNSGTVGIAGVFTTGAAGGHTVTGSSIAFNGTGPQTLPAFTPYNHMTVNNASGISLAGAVTVDGILTLTIGNITTGANTLSIGPNGSIARTDGHVIGTLLKNFSGPGSFTYHVGTTGAYSPLNQTVTSGSGQLTVRANIGMPAVAPIPLDSARTLQRFWTLSGSGIRSNLTFNYLDGDIPATPGTENLWHIIRVTGNTAVRYPPTLPYVIMSPGTNQFTINDLDSYSDWTAGEPLAPTAANVNVSGRVVDTSGRGIYGVRITMQGQSGNVVSTITNPFGYYAFSNVVVGQTYVMTPTHKEYQFQPRTIAVNEELTDVDFAVEPSLRSP